MVRGRKYRKHRAYDVEARKDLSIVQGRENVFNNPLFVFDRATYIKGFFFDGNAIALWRHLEASCLVRIRFYLKRATQKKEPPLYTLVPKKTRIFSRSMNCFYNDPRSTPYTETLTKGRKVYRRPNSPLGQYIVGRDRRNLFVEKGDSVWVMFSMTTRSRDLSAVYAETQALRTFMSTMARGYAWRRRGPRNVSEQENTVASVAEHNRIISPETYSFPVKKRKLADLGFGTIKLEGGREGLATPDQQSKGKDIPEDEEEEEEEEVTMKDEVRTDVEGLRNYDIILYLKMRITVAQPRNA